MKIINEKTVELTAFEQHAKTTFELLLDRGHSIPAAVARVKELAPDMDPAFYRWLEGKPLMPTVEGDENIPLGLSKWCVARLKDSRESGEVDENVSDAVIEREAARLEVLCFQLASSFVDNEFNEQE
jgi:hypothetical protein